MSRKVGYICAVVVLVGLVTGIFVYRIQAKKNSGHLGKEIVYFGEGSSSEASSGESSAESSDDASGEEDSSDAKAKDSGEASDSEQKEAEESAAPAPKQTKEPFPSITSKDKIERYDSTGTVVIGDTGYELYNYVESSASRYAKTINKFTKKVDSGVAIYEMVIPTSVGITLPDNKADQVNSTPQEEALKNIQKKLSGREIYVPLYDTMMRHRTEYIYFRTDHHWTQLGAYYAYAAFCEAKGMEPNPLTAYEKKVSEGFLGTIYVDADKNEHLKQDDVEMYYPICKTLDMQYNSTEKKFIKGSVITDPSNFGIGSKYLAFLCGDNPYTVIVNPEKQDGSSCIVVKESFGNAFVPFLTDHYERVYVIDYRYWTGNLADFIKQKRAKEVLILNNISMTRNAYLIGMLAKILG